jgi:hypothetical protein
MKPEAPAKEARNTREEHLAGRRPSAASARQRNSHFTCGRPRVYLAGFRNRADQFSAPLGRQLYCRPALALFAVPQRPRAGGNMIGHYSRLHK